MTDHYNLAIIIMAGGAGTRFWPLSTEQRPKQFLSVFGDRSLLQMTWDRIVEIVPPERVLVLTNRSYCDLAREHLPMIPPENIVGEPCRRDTAAAVALGAFLCRKRFGDPVIATLTADHIIEPAALFRNTLLSAVREARKNPALYTFGITPTYPATGYGYLERGDKVLDDHGIGHYIVSSFKEKPDIDTATKYIGSGQYLWNSGMFVWRTDEIIRHIRMYLPDHMDILAPIMTADMTDNWDSTLEKAFMELDTLSVDVGIMEKAPDVRCVEAAFSWRDVGGWHALSDHLPVDNNGNYHRGDIVCLDAHDNIVYCENPDETVMTIGVSNLVIVRAGSKTLIVPKDRVEDIKRLDSALKNNTRP